MRPETRQPDMCALLCVWAYGCVFVCVCVFVCKLWFGCCMPHIQWECAFYWVLMWVNELPLTVAYSSMCMHVYKCTNDECLCKGIPCASLSSCMKKIKTETETRNTQRITDENSHRGNKRTTTKRFLRRPQATVRQPVNVYKNVAQSAITWIMNMLC